MRMKRNVSSFVFAIVKYVSLILASIVSLAPVVVCVLTSFKTNEEYASTTVLEFPSSFGYFENFKIAIEKANMLRCFGPCTACGAYGVCIYGFDAGICYQPLYLPGKRND